MDTIKPSIEPEPFVSTPYAETGGTSLMIADISITEQTAEIRFGVPHAGAIGKQDPKGYSAFWYFTETGPTANVATLYFRDGAARIGARNEGTALRFLRFLKDTQTSTKTVQSTKGRASAQRAKARRLRDKWQEGWAAQKGRDEGAIQGGV